MDQAFANFSYAGGTSDRNLVETIQPVHYECATSSQHTECLSDFFDQIEGIDADHLRGSSSGIGERTQKIEYGAQTSFAACILNVLGGGMNCRREQESYAHFF